MLRLFYVKSRNYIKELVNKILFSDDRNKSGIKIGKYNIDDIEEKLFGEDEIGRASCRERV